MPGDDLTQYYEEILVRHRETVWQQCWNYADGNTECCRDLVQEVFAVLWNCRKSIRADATDNEVGVWIRLKTRSVLYNLHRRKKPDLRLLEEALLDIQGDPMEEAKELARDIIQGIADEEDRAYMELRLAGYSSVEIGRMKGISETAVRRRISRIIKKLKKQYNP